MNDAVKRPHGRRWLFLALAAAVLAVLAAAIAYAWVHTGQPATDTRPRRRRWPAAAALAATVVAGALVGGAYAYDAAREQVLMRGLRVGQVPVGGLTATEARRKLVRSYRRLLSPVVVRSGVERFRLDAREANVVVHVDEAVSRALARTRRGWFLARTLRHVAPWGGAADVAPRVTFSQAHVRRFAASVADAVERRPRDATVVPRAGGLVIRAARPGLVVDRPALRRAIERALVGLAGPRDLRVPVRHVAPDVTVAELSRRTPDYITVDRSRFRLRLYERLRLVRTYTVSVGQVGYDTPSGFYRIQNKAVNPTWSVPYSAWTGSLAGAVIPPGPSNPLKARWLGIYAGAGIHGTDQTWSLGSAASHGCIRMAIPDVIELYDRVEVGTPIFIG